RDGYCRALPHNPAYRQFDILAGIYVGAFIDCDCQLIKIVGREKPTISWLLIKSHERGPPKYLRPAVSATCCQAVCTFWWCGLGAQATIPSGFPFRPIGGIIGNDPSSESAPCANPESLNAIFVAAPDTHWIWNIHAVHHAISESVKRL